MRKKRKRLFRILSSFLLGIILCIPQAGNTVYAEDSGYTSLLDGTISDNIIVIAEDTKEVVAARDADAQIYPASMTKMMTLILALENISDYNQTVEITSDMLAGLAEANAAVAGFAVGDTPTVNDLLYATALPSGADAVNALAYTVSGSIEAFVDLMNSKAAEIGMSATHFANPTGLHDDSHVSTCRDMATLLEYCLQNEDFKTILSTRNFTTSSIASHPDGIELEDSMFASIDNAGYTPPGIIGGKTGYTIEAKRCLASWSELNGITYVVVTAHAGYSEDGVPGHTYDINRILSTLETCQRHVLLTPSSVLAEIQLNRLIGTEDFEVTSTENIEKIVPNDSTVQVYAEGLPAELKKELEEQVLDYTCTVKVNGVTMANIPMQVTIPAESNIFYRLCMHIAALFS